MAEDLNEIERAALDLLVSREEEGYPALREQSRQAKVVSRDLSGHGFFTKLVVPDDSPPAPESVGNPLGTGHDFAENAYAEIRGMDHGAGFVLWLAEGRIETLEGFAYIGPWPEEASPEFTMGWGPITRLGP